MSNLEIGATSKKLRLGKFITHPIMGGIVALTIGTGVRIHDILERNYEERYQELIKEDSDKKEVIRVECGDGFIGELYCRKTRTISTTSHDIDSSSIYWTIEGCRQECTSIIEVSKGATSIEAYSKLGKIQDIGSEKKASKIAYEIKRNNPDINITFRGFKEVISQKDINEIKGLLKNIGYNGDFSFESLKEFLGQNIQNPGKISKEDLSKLYLLFRKFNGGQYSIKEEKIFGEDLLDFYIKTFLTEIFLFLIGSYIYYRKTRNEDLYKNLISFEDKIIIGGINIGDKEKELLAERSDKIRKKLSLGNHNSFVELIGKLQQIDIGKTLKVGGLEIKRVGNMDFELNYKGKIQSFHFIDLCHKLEIMKIDYSDFENLSK